MERKSKGRNKTMLDMETREEKRKGGGLRVKRRKLREIKEQNINDFCR